MLKYSLPAWHTTPLTEHYLRNRQYLLSIRQSYLGFKPLDVKSHGPDAVRAFRHPGGKEFFLPLLSSLNITLNLRFSQTQNLVLSGPLHSAIFARPGEAAILLRTACKNTALHTDSHPGSEK